MKKEITRRTAIGAIITGATTSIAGCGGSQSSGDQIGPFEFVFPSRSANSNWNSAANEIVGQVAELGIALEPRTVDFATWVDEYLNNTFNVAHSGMGATPERVDPSIPLGNYFTSATAEEGSWNTSRYANPEYDEIVEDINTTYDREERQEYVYDAQEILAEEVPMVITTYPSARSVYRSDQFSGWTAGVGTNPFGQTVNLRNLEPNGDTTTVVVGETSMPPTLNPMGYQSTPGRTYIPFIYDSLTEISPDGTVEPRAAENIETVDDTTLDVTLREGMTFHDGESVDPEDFQFSIEYYKEWGQPYIESFYNRIESVEVTGDNGFTITLGEPFAGIRTILSLLPIIPEHIWDGVVDENDVDHPSQWSDFDPIGSGPFTADSLELPNNAQLGIHDNHQNDYDIDGFVVQSYGGMSQAIGALEGGDVTYVSGITGTQVERLSDSGEGITTRTEPTHQWYGLALHTTDPPFNDVTLRRAVAHTIDQERIAQLGYGGYASPGISGTPISPANEYWHNPDVTTYDGGVDRGRELLEEAGYRWDNNGNLLYPSGSTETATE
jgi:peptide/nickel transport system substrate-binding protein